MNVNVKVRMKNPLFCVQIVGAAVLTALGYYNMNPSDLTTWQGVGELIVGVAMNPFLLCSVAWSAWCAFNDPTTAGATDSPQALTYETPKNVKENKDQEEH